MYLQVYVPAWVWGMILVTILVLIANAGMNGFNRWMTRKAYKPDNEIAGIVFGVLSLIYSLVIAFVIIAVWENYEQLNRTIEKESGHLNSVLVHSTVLSDTLKTEVAAAVTAYCEKVVRDEWDMSEEGMDLQGSAIPSLRMLLFSAESDSRIIQNVLGVIENDLNNITTLHRERLSHTHAYVPELVWVTLIIDSIMVICFSYFLAMESLPLKRIYLSFLWAIIGFSLFLVYMLDHPFLGSTQVSKAPYEEILRVPSR